PFGPVRLKRRGRTAGHGRPAWCTSRSYGTATSTMWTRPPTPGRSRRRSSRGVVEAFRATGRFLDQRSPDILEAMRAAGLSLRMFVEVRMDQDQMELEFPPELLAACSRHNLGVYVISNDIP